jgi:dephospho-CoA kinase
VDRLGVKGVGLTGGIGSGKSTVSQRLAWLGAHVVDTDAIARSLTLPGGAAIVALREQFGAEAITPEGALDRDHMRRRVFSDADARRRLEAILHPLIGIEARRAAEQARGKPLVYDVPLLAESAQWRSRVQRVLVIDCDAAVQVERVLLRPGWDADSARRVIAQQAGRTQRRRIADAVIENSGSDLAALHAEVDALWQLWFAPG